MSSVSIQIQGRKKPCCTNLKWYKTYVDCEEILNLIVLKRLEYSSELLDLQIDGVDEAVEVTLSLVQVAKLRRPGRQISHLLINDSEERNLKTFIFSYWKIIKWYCFCWHNFLQNLKKYSLESMQTYLSCDNVIIYVNSAYFCWQMRFSNVLLIVTSCWRRQLVVSSDLCIDFLEDLIQLSILDEWQENF